MQLAKGEYLLCTLTEDKLYHILLIQNKIVTKQTEDVSKAAIERAIDTFPYRLESDFSNPLSKFRRERDHLKKRGVTGIAGHKSGVATPLDSVELAIIDDTQDVNGQCLWVMYKMIDNGVIKDNPGLTEAERLHMAKCYYAEHSLPFYRDKQAYLKLEYEPLKDYISKSDFDVMQAKLTAHKGFLPDDDANYLKWCMSLPEALSLKMRYIFASSAKGALMLPDGGATSEDMLKHPGKYYPHPWILPPVHVLRERMKGVDFWLNSLMGTELENKALSFRGQLYCSMEMEDEATDLYKEMLKKDLDPHVRKVIEDKVEYLGYGRNMYNQILELKKSGNMQATLDLCYKWVSESSGVTKMYLHIKVTDIIRECCKALGYWHPEKVKPDANQWRR